MGRSTRWWTTTSRTPTPKPTSAATACRPGNTGSRTSSFFFFQAEDGIRDVAVTGVQTCALPISLWVRRWRVARVAAVTQVSLILWGWALSQYPYILPPDLSIAGAAAPAATLRLVLGALALGALVLLPSLYYLFRVFKSSVRAT